MKRLQKTEAKKGGRFYAGVGKDFWTGEASNVYVTIEY